MSKSKRKALTLNSKAARLDAELNKWRCKQEAAITALIKATLQLKKLGGSVRRLETKQAKLKEEAAQRRAEAKQARAALQEGLAKPLN